MIFFASLFFTHIIILFILCNLHHIYVMNEIIVIFTTFGFYLDSVSPNFIEKLILISL